jgi:hypothetical protein
MISSFVTNGTDRQSKRITFAVFIQFTRNTVKRGFRPCYVIGIDFYLLSKYLAQLFNWRFFREIGRGNLERLSDICQHKTGYLNL